MWTKGLSEQPVPTQLNSEDSLRVVLMDGVNAFSNDLGKGQALSWSSLLIANSVSERDQREEQSGYLDPSVIIQGTRR